MMPSDYISRSQEDKIESLLFSGKLLIITGPRRVGKTTMLKRIVERSQRSFLYLNGEDLSTAELFERRTAENYRDILADSDLLVIDEHKMYRK